MDGDEKKGITRYSDGSQVVSSSSRHHKKQKKTRHEEYRYSSDPSSSPQIQRTFTSEDKEEHTGDPELGALMEKRFSSLPKEGWIVQEKQLTKRSQQVHVRHEVTKNGETTVETKNLGFMEIKHSDDSKDNKSQKFEDRYFHPIHTPSGRERQETKDHHDTSRDKYESSSRISTHRDIHRNEMKENLPVKTIDHYNSSKNAHRMSNKAPNHGEERYEVEEPDKLIKVERQWRQEQTPGHFHRMEIYKTESKGKVVHGDKKQQLYLDYYPQTPDTDDMETTIPIITSPPPESNFSAATKDEKQVRFKKTIEERREDRAKREGSIKRREELEKMEEIKQMEKRKDIEYQIKISKERGETIPAKRRKNSVEFDEPDYPDEERVVSSQHQTHDAYTDHSRKTTQQQIIMEKQMHRRKVLEEQNIHQPQTYQEIPKMPPQYNRNESSFREVQHRTYVQPAESQPSKQKIITTPPSQYYRQKEIIEKQQNIHMQQNYEQPSSRQSFPQNNREIQKVEEPSVQPTKHMEKPIKKQQHIQKEQYVEQHVRQQHVQQEQNIEKQYHQQNVQHQHHVQKEHHIEHMQEQPVKRQPQPLALPPDRQQTQQRQIRQQQQIQHYQMVQHQEQRQEQYSQRQQMQQHLQNVPPPALKQEKKTVKKISFSEDKNVRDLEAKIDRAYWEYQLEEQEKEIMSPHPELQEIIPQNINIKTIEGTDIREDIGEFTSPGHIGLTIKSETVISPNLTQPSSGINVRVETPPQQILLHEEPDWMKEVRVRRSYSTERKIEQHIEDEPDFRKVILKKTTVPDHSFDDSDVQYSTSLMSEGNLKKASSLSHINSVEFHSSQIRNTVSMSNISPPVQSQPQFTHIIPVQSTENINYSSQVNDSAVVTVHNTSALISPILSSETNVMPRAEMMYQEEPSWKTEIKKRKMIKSETNIRQRMEVEDQKPEFASISLKKVDSDIKTETHKMDQSHVTIETNSFIQSYPTVLPNFAQESVLIQEESYYNSPRTSTPVKPVYREEKRSPLSEPAHIDVVTKMPITSGTFSPKTTEDSPSWMLEAKKRKAQRLEDVRSISESEIEPEWKNISLKKVDIDLKKPLSEESLIDVKLKHIEHSSITQEKVQVTQRQEREPITSPPADASKVVLKEKPLRQLYQEISLGDEEKKETIDWRSEVIKKRSEKVKVVHNEQPIEPEWKGIELKKVTLQNNDFNQEYIPEEKTTPIRQEGVMRQQASYSPVPFVKSPKIALSEPHLYTSQQHHSTQISASIHENFQYEKSVSSLSSYETQVQKQVEFQEERPQLKSILIKNIEMEPEALTWRKDVKAINEYRVTETAEEDIKKQLSRRRVSFEMKPVIISDLPQVSAPVVVEPDVLEETISFDTPEQIISDVVMKEVQTELQETIASKQVTYASQKEQNWSTHSAAKKVLFNESQPIVQSLEPLRPFKSPAKSSVKEVFFTEVGTQKHVQHNVQNPHLDEKLYQEVEQYEPVWEEATMEVKEWQQPLQPVHSSSTKTVTKRAAVVAQPETGEPQWMIEAKKRRDQRVEEVKVEKEELFDWKNVQLKKIRQEIPETTVENLKPEPVRQISEVNIPSSEISPSTALFHYEKQMQTEVAIKKNGNRYQNQMEVDVEAVPNSALVEKTFSLPINKSTVNEEYINFQNTKGLSVHQQTFQSSMQYQKQETLFEKAATVQQIPQKSPEISGEMKRDILTYDQGKSLIHSQKHTQNLPVTMESDVRNSAEIPVKLETHQPSTQHLTSMLEREKFTLASQTRDISHVMSQSLNENEEHVRNIGKWQPSFKKADEFIEPQMTEAVVTVEKIPAKYIQYQKQKTLFEKTAAVQQIPEKSPEIPGEMKREILTYDHGKSLIHSQKHIQNLPVTMESDVRHSAEIPIKLETHQPNTQHLTSMLEREKFTLASQTRDISHVMSESLTEEEEHLRNFGKWQPSFKRADEFIEPQMPQAVVTVEKTPVKHMHYQKQKTLFEKTAAVNKIPQKSPEISGEMKQEILNYDQGKSLTHSQKHTQNLAVTMESDVRHSAEIPIKLETHQPNTQYLTSMLEREKFTLASQTRDISHVMSQSLIEKEEAVRNIDKWQPSFKKADEHVESLKPESIVTVEETPVKHMQTDVQTLIMKKSKIEKPEFEVETVEYVHLKPKEQKNELATSAIISLPVTSEYSHSEIDVSKNIILSTPQSLRTSFELEEKDLSGETSNLKKQKIAEHKLITTYEPNKIVNQDAITLSKKEQGVLPHYYKEVNYATSENLQSVNMHQYNKPLETKTLPDSEKHFQTVLHTKVDSKIMSPVFENKFLIRAVPEFSHEDVTEESAKQFTLYQQVDQSFTQIHSGEAISGQVSVTKDSVQNLAALQHEEQQVEIVDPIKTGFDICNPSYRVESVQLKSASEDIAVLSSISSEVILPSEKAKEMNLEKLKTETIKYSHIKPESGQSPIFHREVSIPTERSTPNIAMIHYQKQTNAIGEGTFHTQTQMDISSKQEVSVFQKDVQLPQFLQFSNVSEENNPDLQTKGISFVQTGEHGVIQYHQKERKTEISKKYSSPKVDISLQCHQPADVHFTEQAQVSKIFQNEKPLHSAGFVKIQEKDIKTVPESSQPASLRSLSVNAPILSQDTIYDQKVRNLNVNQPIKHNVSQYYENTLENISTTNITSHLSSTDVVSNMNISKKNTQIIVQDQTNYKNNISSVMPPVNLATISQEITNNQETKDFSVNLHKFDRSVPSYQGESFQKETVELQSPMQEGLAPAYYKEIQMSTQDFPQNVSMIHYQKPLQTEAIPESKNYHNILHLPLQKSQDIIAQQTNLNTVGFSQSDVNVGQLRSFTLYQESQQIEPSYQKQNPLTEKASVIQSHVQHDQANFQTNFKTEPSIKLQYHQTHNVPMQQSSENFKSSLLNSQNIDSSAVTDSSFSSVASVERSLSNVSFQHDDSKVRDDSVLEITDWKPELSQINRIQEQQSWLVEAKDNKTQVLRNQPELNSKRIDVKESEENEEWKRLKLKQFVRSNSETGEVIMDIDDEDMNSNTVDSYQKQKHFFHSNILQKSDSQGMNYELLDSGQNKIKISKETEKFYQQNTSGTVIIKNEQPAWNTKVESHRQFSENIARNFNVSQQKAHYSKEYGETEMTVHYLDEEEEDEPSWKKQIRQRKELRKLEDNVVHYSLEPEFHKISLKKIPVDESQINPEEAPWITELKLQPQHQQRYDIHENYVVPENRNQITSQTYSAFYTMPKLTEDVILQLEEYYKQRKNERRNSDSSSLYKQFSEEDLLHLELYYKQLQYQKQGSQTSLTSRKLNEDEMKDLENYYRLKREQLYGQSRTNIPSSKLTEADILLLEDHYRRIQREKETSFSLLTHELSENEINQLEQYYKEMKEKKRDPSTSFSSWRLSESEIGELEDYYRQRREEKQRQNRIVFLSSQLTEKDILQLEELYKQKKEKMKKEVSAIPCNLSEAEVIQLEQYYREMREKKQISGFSSIDHRLSEGEIQELEEFYRYKKEQVHQRSEVTFSTNKLTEDDILQLENFYKQKKELMKDKVFIVPRILSEDQVVQLEQYYKEIRDQKGITGVSLVSHRLTENEIEELEKYYNQQREEKQRQFSSSFPTSKLTEDDILQLEEFYKQKKNLKSKMFLIPRMLTEEQVTQLEEYYKQLRDEKQVKISNTSIIVQRLSETEIHELENFYRHEKEEKQKQSKVNFPAPKLTEEDILQLEEFYKQRKENIKSELFFMSRELSEEQVIQLEEYYKQLRKNKQVSSPSFNSRRLTESEILELEIFYQQKREVQKKSEVNFSTRKLTEIDIMQLEEFYKQRKQKIKSELFFTPHELSEEQVVQLEEYYKQLKEPKSMSSTTFSTQRLTEKEIEELEDYYRQQRNEKQKQTAVNYLTHKLTEEDIVKLEEFYKQKKEKVKSELLIMSRELTEDQVAQLEEYYKYLKEAKYTSSSLITHRLSEREIDELEEFYRRKREESQNQNEISYSTPKLTEADILQLEEFYKQKKDNLKSEFFIMPRELSEEEIFELEQYYKQLREQKCGSDLSFNTRKLTEGEIDELEDYYQKKRNERNKHLKVTVPTRELSEEEILELEEYYQLQKEGKHVSSIIIPRELTEDEILQLEIYYKKLREKRVRFNDTVRVQRLSEEEIEKLEEYYKQLREEKNIKTDSPYIIHQLSEEDIIELENYYREQKRGNQTSSIIVPHLSEGDIIQLEEYYKTMREVKYKLDKTISVRGLTEKEIHELEEFYHQQRIIKQQKVEPFYLKRALTEKEIIELEEYFQKKREGFKKSSVFAPRLTEEQIEQLEEYYRQMKEDKNKTEVTVNRRYLTEEEIQELEEYYRRKRMESQQETKTIYVTHKLTEREIMELEEYYQKKREGTEKSSIFVPRELTEEEINQLEEYYKAMREEKLKSDSVVQTFRLSEKEIQELEEYYSQKRKERQQQLNTTNVTSSKLTELEIQELENYYRLKREGLQKSTEIVNRELSEEQIQQLEEYYKKVRENKLKSDTQLFSHRLTEKELQELEEHYKIKREQKLKQPERISQSSRLTENEIIELEHFYKQKREGTMANLEMGGRHLSKEQIEQLEDYYKCIREEKYKLGSSVEGHRLNEEELQELEEYYKKKRKEKNQAEYLIKTRELTKKDLRDLEIYYRERRKEKQHEPDPCWVVETRSRMSERMQKVLGLKKKENWIDTEWKTISDVVIDDESWLNYIEEQRLKKVLEESGMYHPVTLDSTKDSLTKPLQEQKSYVKDGTTSDLGSSQPGYSSIPFTLTSSSDDPQKISQNTHSLNQQCEENDINNATADKQFLTEEGIVNAADSTELTPLSMNEIGVDKTSFQNKEAWWQQKSQTQEIKTEKSLEWMNSHLKSGLPDQHIPGVTSDWIQPPLKSSDVLAVHINESATITLHPQTMHQQSTKCNIMQPDREAFVIQITNNPYHSKGADQMISSYEIIDEDFTNSKFSKPLFRERKQKHWENIQINEEEKFPSSRICVQNSELRSSDTISTSFSTLIPTNHLCNKDQLHPSDHSISELEYQRVVDGIQFSGITINDRINAISENQNGSDEPAWKKLVKDRRRFNSKTQSIIINEENKEPEWKRISLKPSIINSRDIVSQEHKIIPHDLSSQENKTKELDMSTVNSSFSHHGVYPPKQTREEIIIDVDDWQPPNVFSPSRTSINTPQESFSKEISIKEEIPDAEPSWKREVKERRIIRKSQEIEAEKKDEEPEWKRVNLRHSSSRNLKNLESNSDLYQHHHEIQIGPHGEASEHFNSSLNYQNFVHSTPNLSEDEFEWRQVSHRASPGKLSTSSLESEGSRPKSVDVASILNDPNIDILKVLARIDLSSHKGHSKSNLNISYQEKNAITTETGDWQPPVLSKPMGLDNDIKKSSSVPNLSTSLDSEPDWKKEIKQRKTERKEGLLIQTIQQEPEWKKVHLKQAVVGTVKHLVCNSFDSKGQDAMTADESYSYSNNHLSTIPTTYNAVNHGDSQIRSPPLQQQSSSNSKRHWNTQINTNKARHLSSEEIKEPEWKSITLKKSLPVKKHLINDPPEWEKASLRHSELESLPLSYSVETLPSGGHLSHQTISNKHESEKYFQSGEVFIDTDKRTTDISSSNPSLIHKGINSYPTQTVGHLYQKDIQNNRSTGFNHETTTKIFSQIQREISAADSMKTTKEMRPSYQKELDQRRASQLSSQSFTAHHSSTSSVNFSQQSSPRDSPHHREEFLLDVTDSTFSPSHKDPTVKRHSSLSVIPNVKDSENNEPLWRKIARERKTRRLTQELKTDKIEDEEPEWKHFNLKKSLQVEKVHDHIEPEWKQPQLKHGEEDVSSTVIVRSYEDRNSEQEPSNAELTAGVPVTDKILYIKVDDYMPPHLESQSRLSPAKKHPSLSQSFPDLSQVKEEEPSWKREVKERKARRSTLEIPKQEPQKKEPEWKKVTLKKSASVREPPTHMKSQDISTTYNNVYHNSYSSLSHMENYNGYSTNISPVNNSSGLAGNGAKEEFIITEKDWNTVTSSPQVSMSVLARPVEAKINTNINQFVLPSDITNEEKSDWKKMIKHRRTHKKVEEPTMETNQVPEWKRFALKRTTLVTTQPTGQEPSQKTETHSKTESEPHLVEITKRSSSAVRTTPRSQYVVSKSVSVPNLSEATDEEPIWKKEIKERKLRKTQEISQTVDQIKETEPEWRNINLKKLSPERGSTVTDVSALISTSQLIEEQQTLRPIPHLNREEFIIEFDDWKSDKTKSVPRKTSETSLYLSSSVPDLSDASNKEPSWKKEVKERRLRKSHDVVVANTATEPEWKNITLKTSRPSRPSVELDDEDKIITTTTPLNEYLKSPPSLKEFYIEAEDWRPSVSVQNTKKSSSIPSPSAPEKVHSGEPDWKKEVKERRARKMQENIEIIKQSPEITSSLKLKPAEIKSILPSKLIQESLHISSSSSTEPHDVVNSQVVYQSQVSLSRFENTEEQKTPTSVSSIKSPASPISQNIFKTSSVPSLVNVEDNVPAWKKEILEQRARRTHSETTPQSQTDPPIVIEINSWKTPMSPTKQQLIQRSHSMSSLGEPEDNEPEWKKQVRERKSRDVRISPTRRSESFKHKTEPEWKQEVQKKKTQRAMTTDISHSLHQEYISGDSEVINSSSQKYEEPQIVIVERSEHDSPLKKNEYLSQQQAVSYQSVANISTKKSPTFSSSEDHTAYRTTVSPSQKIDISKDIHIHATTSDSQTYETTNIVYAATVPLHSPGKKEIEVTPISTSSTKIVAGSPTKITEQSLESLVITEKSPESVEPAWKAEIKKRRSERQEREQIEPPKPSQLSLRELMHKEFYEKMQTQNDEHPVSSVIQNKKSHSRIISRMEESEDQQNTSENASTFVSIHKMSDQSSPSKANLIVTSNSQIPPDLEKVMSETLQELKSSTYHMRSPMQQSEVVMSHQEIPSSRSPIILELKMDRRSPESHIRTGKGSSVIKEETKNGQTAPSHMSSYFSEASDTLDADHAFKFKKQNYSHISQRDDTESISSISEQNIFMEESKINSTHSMVSSSTASSIPIKGTRKIRTVVRKLVDGDWQDIDVKEEVYPLESQPETPSDVSEITMTSSSTNGTTTIRGKRKVKTIIRKLVDGEWQDVEVKEEIYPVDRSNSQSFETTSNVMKESYNSSRLLEESYVKKS